MKASSRNKKVPQNSPKTMTAYLRIAGGKAAPTGPLRERKFVFILRANAREVRSMQEDTVKGKKKRRNKEEAQRSTISHY